MGRQVFGRPGENSGFIKTGGPKLGPPDQNKRRLGMRTQYQGWGTLFFAWGIMSGIFVFWLASNVVLGVTIGAALGWVFSLTFLGRWIIEGLKAFRLDLSDGKLYQIGAAAGFISSFFKFSVKAPEWKAGKGEKA